MPDWIRRTALADILGADFNTLVDESFYQNLDRLHPRRALIEHGLAERERTLFNLDESVYLYDLTSTYFEGPCPHNPQAQRGDSRDSRPDCTQVVVGLVLDREGFPKAHEVFDGHRTDRTTLADMLEILEARTGRTGGATVVVDRACRQAGRGMAFDKMCLDAGLHTFRATLREALSTHQVVTVVLPASNGDRVADPQGIDAGAAAQGHLRDLPTAGRPCAFPQRS